MKKLLIISLFLGATNLFAQQNQDSTIATTFRILQERVNQQQLDIRNLYSELDKEYRTYRIVKSDLNKTIISKQEEVIDSLNALIGVSNKKLKYINDKLDSKIQEANLKTDSQFAQLDNSVEKNKLYWIIATLITLLLGGLIYFFLKNLINSNKSDVETQIKNTNKSLEEESVKLDSKLVEVLESQMKLQEANGKTAQLPNSNGKEDHSLALKVADEIIRIQKNLSRMDDSIKGLKQLNSSVHRIQDNFAANGYELVEMLGKDYNEGMKVTANFTPSENLEPGKHIISRIIKPQVNFKGEMIQAAQIEVSVGE
jgi:flagellar motor protein MotB